jgi:cysteine desulfuration protein SufE
MSHVPHFIYLCPSNTAFMTITETETQIISEFAMFDDWMDKYNYLIDLGKSLPDVEEQYKTDQYLISGCQSKVWLHAVMNDGKVFFKGDSDAIITKGIVNMLIRVLSDKTPDEIIHAKLEFIDQIGLKEHLSPTRSNGLGSMIKQMKLYATVFRMKGG